MGASKYTDAERIAVLGLYVENVPFGKIVTRTELSRTAVASILGNMYRKSQSPTILDPWIEEIYHAAPKPEPTPLQSRARRAL